MLLVTLISRHLVRLLKTAPSLQVLDGTTLAIQELLKHYSQAEGLEEAVPGAADAQQQQQQQQKGWPGVPVAQRSREATPAGAEGNLLFAALAPEVQVRAETLLAGTATSLTASLQASQRFRLP